MMATQSGDDSQYIKDAESIWADFKKRMKSDSKFAEMNIDEQLDYYQKQHHNFTMTFPIVLRYMIQLRLYSKKAFVKYLKKLRANPYKSELEYCERQADYVKYLYMEVSGTHNMKEAQDKWQQTYDMLAEEVEIFKKANEKVKQKLEKNNNQNNIEKREELKKALGLQ